MSLSFRAVIFDMDGTIIDNMRYHADVWVSLAARLGVSIDTVTVEQQFAGKKNDEILVALDPSLTPEDMQRIAEEKEALYRAAYAPHLTAMPGFMILLEELRARGLPCLVATAAPRENRDLVLDGLGLRNSFDAVIGAESVTRGKPFPDIFLRAAEAAGVAPSDCLVFEDAVNGVLAARAAGMQAVGVLTTTSAAALRAAGARWTISDFSELPPDLTVELGLGDLGAG